jgi:molecular chaperone HtpG
LESSAGGTFTITASTEPKRTRGTTITLHLKDDKKEYLDEKCLTDLVKNHSEFIGFLISLWTEKTTEKEVPADGEVAKDEETYKPKIEEVDEEEDKQPKTKKVKETTNQWERLKKQKPLPL